MLLRMQVVSEAREVSLGHKISIHNAVRASQTRQHMRCVDAQQLGNTRSSDHDVVRQEMQLSMDSRPGRSKRGLQRSMPSCMEGRLKLSHVLEWAGKVSERRLKKKSYILHKIMSQRLLALETPNSRQRSH